MVRFINDINEENVEEYKTIKATTVKVETFKKCKNETKNEIKVAELIDDRIRDKKDYEILNLCKDKENKDLMEKILQDLFK